MSKDRFGIYLRRFVILIALAWLVLMLIGTYRNEYGGSDLVKPCEGITGDMYQECVGYYIERGWTWDEIKNGILVTNK